MRARAVLVIELLAKRLPGSHVRTRDPPFRAATTVPTGRAATPGHSSGPSLRHAIAPFGNVLSLAPDEMNEMTLTLHNRATLSVLLLSAAGSLVAACGASTTNAACRVTSATAADVAVNAASGCWDCSRGAAEGRSSAWSAESNSPVAVAASEHVDTASLVTRSRRPRGAVPCELVPG